MQPTVSSSAASQPQRRGTGRQPATRASRVSRVVRFWPAIGIVLIVAGVIVAAIAVCALLMLPVGQHTSQDIHARSSGGSGGAGVDLYSIVNYPLTMEVGKQDTASLLLSTDGNVVTLQPKPGTGVTGAKLLIPLPYDPWDYRKIFAYATVQTAPSGAGPVAWQPDGQTQAELVPYYAPEDAMKMEASGAKFYVDAVQFRWTVRAVADGTNTAKIVINIYGITRAGGLLYFDETGVGTPKATDIPVVVPPIVAIPSKGIMAALASAGGGIALVGLLLQFGKVAEALQKVFNTGKDFVSTFRTPSQPSQPSQPSLSASATVQSDTPPGLNPSSEVGPLESPRSAAIPGHAVGYTLELSATPSTSHTSTMTIHVRDAHGTPIQYINVELPLQTDGGTYERQASPDVIAPNKAGV